MHLVDKHMFPKDYDFSVINDGIDQRSSMLRSGRHRRRSSAVQHKTDIEERARRRSSTLSNIDGGNDDIKKNAYMTGNGEDDNNDETAEVQDKKDAIAGKDSDMEGLVGAMSSLKFVPPSVRFGRGRGKGGFSRS